MRIKEIIYEYKNLIEAKNHIYKIQEKNFMLIYSCWKQNYFGEYILEVKYVNNNL